MNSSCERRPSVKIALELISITAKELITRFPSNKVTNRIMSQFTACHFSRIHVRLKITVDFLY